MPSSMNKRPRMLTEAEQKRLREFPDLIHYSNRYSDDIYEYRHVILPKAMLKAIPRDYFDPETQTLKILHEEEWRGLGITQVWLYVERSVLILTIPVCVLSFY